MKTGRTRLFPDCEIGQIKLKASDVPLLNEIATSAVLKRERGFELSNFHARVIRAQQTRNAFVLPYILPYWSVLFVLSLICSFGGTTKFSSSLCYCYTGAGTRMTLDGILKRICASIYRAWRQIAEKTSYFTRHCLK